MHELTRGQKVKLAVLGIADEFDVHLHVLSNATFDFCAIGVDSDERLSDERYFVYFNQPRSPCGGVELVSPRVGETARLRLRLDRVPPRVDRIVIALAIDGRETMSHVKRSEIRLSIGDVQHARFQFGGADFTIERSVMLLEVYRRDGWRLAAVGQGFDGGLQTVLERYGGVVVDESEGASGAGPSGREVGSERLTREVVPTIVSSKPASVPAAVGEPIRLEATGDRRTIRLARPELGLAGATQLQFELLWDSSARRQDVQTFGLGRSTARDVVLELGVLVQGTDGRSFCVQTPGPSLPNALGLAAGDALSDGGRSVGREIFVARSMDRVARMLVYACIYEGTARFRDVLTRLLIRDDTGSHLILPAASTEMRGLWAIALLERSEAGIDVSRLDLSFPGQEICDAYFGFGVQWGPAPSDTGPQHRGHSIRSPGSPG